MLRILFRALMLIVLTALIGCAAAQTETPSPATDVPSPEASFTLASTAFASGGQIPSRYTCQGEEVSPALSWTAPPEGTRSFALIMDDPDAPNGTWTHWVIFNLPPEYRSLDEGLPARNKLDDGVVQGKNSWHKFGYRGPCPPSGTHHYAFHLYALDTLLDLGPGTTAERLRQAMDGHVLAEAVLTGLFGK